MSNAVQSSQSEQRPALRRTHSLASAEVLGETFRMLPCCVLTQDLNHSFIFTLTI